MLSQPVDPMGVVEKVAVAAGVVWWTGTVTGGVTGPSPSFGPDRLPLRRCSNNPCNPIPALVEGLDVTLRQIGVGSDVRQ